MAQAIVNPDEIRKFIGEMKRFKSELEQNRDRTKGKMRELGETWRDQEHQKFASEFENFIRQMNPFLKNIEEYNSFLNRKAVAADTYLQQR
jgi:uncharacterized protein YukE